MVRVVRPPIREGLPPLPDVQSSEAKTRSSSGDPMTHPNLLRLGRSCAKWRVGILLVAYLGLSCTDPSGISTRTSNMLVGATQQLAPGVGTWSSNNVIVATVDSVGLVRAVAEGTATMTAVGAGRTSFVIVTVTASLAITALLVLPSSVTIPVGAVQQLCAAYQFPNGAIAIATAARPVCDSIYQRLVPLATRSLVTPAQQATVDR